MLLRLLPCPVLPGPCQRLRPQLPELREGDGGWEAASEVTVFFFFTKNRLYIVFICIPGKKSFHLARTTFSLNFIHQPSNHL